MNAQPGAARAWRGAESKKSAGVARRSVGKAGWSAGDFVKAIAGFGFCGFDFEPVLLGGSGEEAPHAVGLPVGRLLDLGELTT